MMLEGKNLCFGCVRKQDSKIMENVNFMLNAGERIGLSAPSGTGKTTLCKLLAGYEQPETGQVLLDGQPLHTYRGFCPVQMIWQNPELAVNPRLPLGKTLNEAGPVEERILRKLHIEPAWMKRYPRELSGGELQRFCIARALHPSVRFLLCDEISAMLDMITQVQLWDFLIEEAKQRGLGLLIVSHNRPLLDKLCSRIITDI